MKSLLISLYCVLSFISVSHAQDDMIVVAVGKAEKEVLGIGFSNLSQTKINGTQDKKSIEKLLKKMASDFGFYKKLFNPKLISSNSFEAWKSSGLGYVTTFEFTKSEVLSFIAKTYNVETKEMIFTKSGILIPGNENREAHGMSDMIYQKITKKKSIFNSKIVFVTDRHSTRQKVIKELYIMDFDGGNKRRLTYHKGLVISPAISYDGQKILYSLISGKVTVKQNINLRIFDIPSRTSKLVSSKKGINSGAVFLPGDKEIALTLSHSGNAEIYVLNLSTKKTRRLTKHYSPDVDPSINIKGDMMTFLSSRPGSAHIYTSGTSGAEKSVKRISYVGDFNATPRFSPDGSEIVFSSWLDQKFDIFRISSKGRNLSRLTKDFGSNEEPTYSNDGQFIAFTSQRVLSRRKAIQNVWIMDRDGEIIGQATKKFGNCITPRWSK